MTCFTCFAGHNLSEIERREGLEGWIAWYGYQTRTGGVMGDVDVLVVLVVLR